MTERNQDPRLDTGLWDSLSDDYRRALQGVRDEVSGPDHSWAAPLLQEVPGLPESWRGMVSVAPPAPEPAPSVTWEQVRETIDRIMTRDVITEAAPLSLTTRPRQNGETLESCLALLSELERVNRTRIIIGPADWARVLDAADEETRARLDDGQRRGVIVVSPYLPGQGVAYGIDVGKVEDAFRAAYASNPFPRWIPR